MLDDIFCEVNKITEVSRIYCHSISNHLYLNSGTLNDPSVHMYTMNLCQEWMRESCMSNHVSSSAKAITIYAIIYEPTRQMPWKGFPVLKASCWYNYFLNLVLSLVICRIHSIGVFTGFSMTIDFMKDYKLIRNTSKHCKVNLY